MGNQENSAEFPIRSSFLEKGLRFVYFRLYQLHIFVYILSIGVCLLSQLAHIRIPVLQDFTAGFLVFWMPGFCVVFVLWGRTKEFDPIMLLPLVLLFSQVTIIICGLTFPLIGILWNWPVVLIVVSVFPIACFGIARKWKGFVYPPIPPLKNCENFDEFQEKYTQGEIIPKNFGYLLIFLVLIGIFSVLGFTVLSDEDPWFHAAILKTILESGVVPYDAFRGCLGMHVFAAAFGELASLNALEVARWFPIYLVVNGNLAFFLLIQRLFHKYQYSILGTLLLSFCPWGYLSSENMFWANAFAVPFALYLMFFLFDGNLQKSVSPSFKRQYIFLGILLFTILCFIHDVIFLTFWLGALFFQIFYTKNKQILLSSFIVIFSAGVIFLLAHGVGYQSIIFEFPKILFQFPLWLWILIVPVAFIGYIIVKKFAYSSNDSFKSFLHGKASDTSFYKFEKWGLKFFPAMIIVLTPIISYLTLTIIFYANPIQYGIEAVTTTFNFLVGFTVALGLLCIWRRGKPGKLTFFWGLFFFVGFIGFMLYDNLVLQMNLTLRFAMFSSPAVVLLITGYIHRCFASPQFNVSRTKKLIGVFAIGCLCFSLPPALNYRCLINYEVASAEQLGTSIPMNSTFVGAFRWAYSLDYYSNRSNLYLWDTGALVFQNGSQGNLQDLENWRQSQTASNVYILLDSSYLTYGVGGLSTYSFGIMTQDNITTYQNIIYLNHIYSSCAGSNNWVMCFALA